MSSIILKGDIPKFACSLILLLPREQNDSTPLREIPQWDVFLLCCVRHVVGRGLPTCPLRAKAHCKSIKGCHEWSPSSCYSGKWSQGVTEWMMSMKMTWIIRPGLHSHWISVQCIICWVVLNSPLHHQNTKWVLVTVTVIPLCSFLLCFDGGGRSILTCPKSSIGVHLGLGKYLQHHNGATGSWSIKGFPYNNYFINT